MISQYDNNCKFQRLYERLALSGSSSPPLIYLNVIGFGAALGEQKILNHACSTGLDLFLSMNSSISFIASTKVEKREMQLNFCA